jgi:dienelactone hydrolase
MRARRLALAVTAALAASSCGAGATRPAPPAHLATTTTTAAPPTLTTSTAIATTLRPRTRRPRIHVVITVLHLVDPRRTMMVGARTVARHFAVIVRLPAGAPGRRPLIVFGHGYAVTPAPYAPLLDAWTRAGYVVAAPVFPLENAGAPGGPNERDLPNQPGDMSLVITALTHPDTAALARVAARVDPHAIAVAGQSDGGDTALAAADDPAVRDPRIDAAVILSGAFDPFVPTFAMPASGPPLLATQGTADTINPPALTAAFFAAAPRPKYLLELLGAGHLPPYTEPGPALSAVRRTTIAFLDAYLRHRAAGLHRLIAEAPGPGARLTALR